MRPFFGTAFFNYRAMDIFIYLLSGLFNLALCVWTYNRFSRTNSEFSFLGIILSALPFFWYLMFILRLPNPQQVIPYDLIALVLLSGAALLTFFLDRILSLLFKINIFKGLILIFHVLALVIAAGSYLIYQFPLLLIMVSTWTKSLQDLSAFHLSWQSLNPAAQQEKMFSWLTRVLTALAASLPFFILRFVFAVRKQKMLEKEISQLKQDLELLKKEIMVKKE